MDDPQGDEPTTEDRELLDADPGYIVWLDSIDRSVYAADESNEARTEQEW